MPQREQFEDVYPDNDDDVEEYIEDEDPENTFGVDRSALNRVENKLKSLEGRMAKASNNRDTANTSIEVLESYGKFMKPSAVDVSKLEEYLQLYRKERERLTGLQQESLTDLGEMQKQADRLTREKKMLQSVFDKQRYPAAKQERLERSRKRKALDIKRSEKERVKQERMMYWPHRVAKVVLHLDGVSDSTPGSSRRSSVVHTEKSSMTGQGPDTVSFSLNYVTAKATWSPRYELTLETPTSTGKVVYRAEYHNYSSETWRDARLILSTSQTSFSGIDEKMPTLQPWNVQLRLDDSEDKKKDTLSPWQGGLENTVESQARSESWQKRALARTRGKMELLHTVDMIQQFAPHSYVPQQTASRGLRGDPANNQQSTTPGSAEQAEAVGSEQSEDGDNSDDGEEPDADIEDLSTSKKELTFQETSRQDYGLTTSYDIPGTRTIRPSSLKRRHVIAELNLTNTTFSHVVVPKLRAAAFLRARITNTSSISFLRGNAGLTLDGTFLGTTSIPNCSPNSAFNLSLGVDPAIQVAYAKPTVRRATSGFFNKEDCAIFTRVCRVTNTKTTPVSISVHDQVPVSEDERLRVGILQPKGLAKEGDYVKVGEEVSTTTTAVAAGSGSGGNSSNKGASWGNGSVGMGKGGNITWQLTLEKGKAVKLTLEYEAKIPGGQKIVGLDE